MINTFKDNIENNDELNNLKINFKMYDKLSIYIKYITTNTINKEDFDDLYEICLFVEDVDLEHLSNYVINIINNLYLENENEINKYFYYLELFYTNNMMKQYYQLISKYYITDFIDSDKFIEKLKKTKTNSDPLKFYLHTIENLFNFKYKTVNFATHINVIN